MMVNWQHISSLESVTDMWLTLRDWILDLRNRFVPYSPKKTGKGVPWTRSQHRRARQVKQFVFSLFKAYPSHATLSVNKAESRRLSKLLRISRRQYDSKLTGEVKFNSTRVFAHFRRNRRLKQRIMALRADGAVLTDSPNMAPILANYYASVYRTDEGKDHPSLPEPSAIMNALRFTSAAVHKELSTLDTAKGSGPDDLHPIHVADSS